VAESETSHIGIIVRQGAADFRDYRRLMKVNMFGGQQLVMLVTGTVPRGCRAWMIWLTKSCDQSNVKVVECARMQKCEDFAPRGSDCASAHAANQLLQVTGLLA
jgi:hypothetical protein